RVTRTRVFSKSGIPGRSVRGPATQRGASLKPREVLRGRRSYTNVTESPHGCNISREASRRPEREPFLALCLRAPTEHPMLKKNLLKLATYTALAASATLPATAEESSALVDALVRKGVLTTKEADEIRADMAREAETKPASSADKI